MCSWYVIFVRLSSESRQQSHIMSDYSQHKLRPQFYKSVYKVIPSDILIQTEKAEHQSDAPLIFNLPFRVSILAPIAYVARQQEMRSVVLGWDRVHFPHTETTDSSNDTQLAQAASLLSPFSMPTWGLLTPFWCPRRDLNPHSFRKWILNPSRLPVSPLGHYFGGPAWNRTRAVPLSGDHEV